MVESEILAKTNPAFLEKNSPVTIVIEQSSAGQHQSKVIDVYGQQIEPSANIVHAIISFRYIAIILAGANVATLSIMLQEYA